MGQHADTRRPGAARLAAAPLTFLIAALAGSPAAAQDYPSRTVGDWTVAASKDGEGCFITRTFDGSGDTTLLLGLNTSGSNHLSVLNENWSIKPKARMALSFRLSGGGYPDHPVVGMAADGKKGFVTDFDPKFLGHFAASKALHIYRGKVPVEQLPLVGSGAAVTELRRCVDLLQARSRAPAADPKRSTRIPKDPFAPGAKAP